MATATLHIENIGGWAPVTHIYKLSEAFDGWHHVAVTAAASQFSSQTHIVPATPTGAIGRDGAPDQVQAYRVYTDLTHEQALAEIGYELATGEF